jgi:hypothetical protein
MYPSPLCNSYTGFVGEGFGFWDIEQIVYFEKKLKLEAEELDKSWDDLQQGNVHPDAWAQIAPETESERLEIDMDKQPEEEVEVEHLPELDNEGPICFVEYRFDEKGFTCSITTC